MTYNDNFMKAYELLRMIQHGLGGNCTVSFRVNEQDQALNVWVIWPDNQGVMRQYDPKTLMDPRYDLLDMFIEEVYPPIRLKESEV